jgi:alkylation response protein AidB-like acyl-CoA dehydrogenase
MVARQHATLFSDRLSQAVAEIECLVTEADRRIEELEQQCRVPQDLFERLADAGAFMLSVPEELGGLGMDIPCLVTLTRRLARLEPSTAWVVCQGALGSVFVVILGHPDLVRDFLATPRANLAANAAPRGRAEWLGHGRIRVSGQWSFCTGAPHATLLGGTTVVEGDVGAHGSPVIYQAFLPSHQVTVLETWDPVGLRGTGSPDIQIDPVEVEEWRLMRLFHDEPVDSPLGRVMFRGFWTIGAVGAAVQLGIARRALDELIAMAPNRVPTRAVSLLLQDPGYHRDLARAEAALAAAQAALDHALDDLWAAVSSGALPTIRQRVAIRIAAVWAAWTAIDVVSIACQYAGGQSLPRGCPLERCLRDVNVLCHHAQLTPRAYETVGRLLSGVDADNPYV